MHAVFKHTFPAVQGQIIKLEKLLIQPFSLTNVHLTMNAKHFDLHSAIQVCEFLSACKVGTHHVGNISVSSTEAHIH